MTQSIIDCLIQVLDPTQSGLTIGLHEPSFQGTRAWSYVKECLDSGWVSSAGEWVNRFETQLCKTTGAKHAVAVANGTVALRLALHVAGVMAGDEVLMPPLSFVATANAASHLGAVPHFVDVDPCRLSLDPAASHSRLAEIAERQGSHLLNRETGRRISAVVPVHVFGHPADMPALMNVCEQWGLPIVEDAAEALGSWCQDTHCGLFGDLGILSFNGNKLITTGGGGALLTNSEELAVRARHLSTTAKLPHQWEFVHDSVAWNDRLPNINAALGAAQLEDLESRLVAKKELASRYAEALVGQDSVEIVPEPSGCISNHWLVTLRFTHPDPCLADSARHDLLQEAHRRGILARPVWKPLHTLPMFQESPHSSLPVAEDLGYRLLNVPSSPQLVPALYP